MIIGNGYAREGQKRAQVIKPASYLIRRDLYCRFSSHTEDDSSICNTHRRLREPLSGSTWKPRSRSHTEGVCGASSAPPTLMQPLYRKQGSVWGLASFG